MAVKIRLKRLGRRHSPFYRVVVAESSTPRDGKTLEIVGTHNPLLKETDIKKERIEHWLSVGATPSETVSRLLNSLDIVKKSPKASSNKGVSKKDRKADA